MFDNDLVTQEASLYYSSDLALFPTIQPMAAQLSNEGRAPIS